MRRIWHGKGQVLDTNGDPVPGAKLEFFEAGTSNQLDTYSDYALTTPNTNPVVADSGGYVTIFLKKNTLYDYTCVDADDVTVYAKITNVSSFDSVLTTKGDVWGYSTTDTRVGVGADGTYLKADSSAATGVSWDNPSEATLTTKGDLYTYDTGNARLPVGNDGDILVVDSGETTGLKWRAVEKVGAYLSGNQALTQNVATKVVFDTEEFDSGADFATGTFTAPAAGYYIVSAAVQAATLGDNDPFDVYLYKNGSLFKRLHEAGTSTSGTEQPVWGGTVLLSLAASDTIDIYARTEDAGINAVGAQSGTYITILRVA